MLKSVVLCVLLWHGMCELSSRAHPISTDTRIPNFFACVSSKINDTDVQIEPGVTYNINNFITDIFYVPFFGTIPSTTPSTIPSTIPSTTPSTIPSTTYPIQIRPELGYLVTKGIGAHKLHAEKRTWHEARQICIDEGGDLADIRSNEEKEIVEKLVIDTPAFIPWIGLHAGPWISVFNETVIESEWTHFFNGAPFTYEQCVGYYVKGKIRGLSTNPCGALRSFICKIPII